MNWSLISTAAAIGLAGGVHCVAMCSAPATLAAGRHTLAFQAGRVLGYALLGIVAALGAASFSYVASEAGWMRPLWLMAHVALILLGGWMLISGRHPAWLQQQLLDLSRHLTKWVQRGSGVGWVVPAATTGSGGSAEIHIHPSIPRQESQFRVVGRRVLLGMAWALIPCGLLYSAVMLAWMSGDVATGAVSMATFGVVSGMQLWLGQRGLAALLRAGRESTAIRIAGAVTVLGAGLLMWWATMGHSPGGFCLPSF